MLLRSASEHPKEGDPVSDKDRQTQLRAAFEQLWDGGSDAGALAPSPWPPVHFGISGHTFYDSSTWARHGNASTTGGPAPSPAITIEDLRDSGDVALVVGEGPMPDESAESGGQARMRSTAIFVWHEDGWRVVHSHWSRRSDKPRPGGV
jgi:hypothetical protein